MKTIACPECGNKVRPCNLARHQKSHLPIPEKRLDTRAYGSAFGEYVYYHTPKRPLIQSRGRDHRYDEVAPRGVGGTRFRIYRLRGGELQLLAAAAYPHSFGVALFDLYSKGEFIPDDAVGVLDTAEEPGGWIVHPFALGRTRRDG